MPTATHKQFTVRIPKALYAEAQRLARRKGTSLNQLAACGLSELARQERERRLRDAYEQLAQVPGEMDVEGFRAAQAEVIRDE
ncbi:MAG TPA: toxin-antitoxin system HicB family antitoxin [Terracidiphilus sp.]